MLNHKTAVLVSCTTSFWGPWRKSRKATQDAAEANHASPSALRASKNLAGALDKELTAVSNCRAALRDVFRRNTVDWKGELRALPNTNSMKFFEEYGAAKNALDAAAEAFFNAYTPFYDLLHKADAFNVSGLGELHNINDYPTPDAIRNTYSVKLDVMEIPQSGDIRVEGFSEDEANKLVEMAKQSMADSLNRITVSHLRKLLPKVERMAVTLDKEVKFHSTMLSNLKDTIDLVKRLNLTGDPTVTELCDLCETSLLQHSREVLLENVDVRHTVSEQAKVLAKVMSGAIDAISPDVVNGEGEA